MWPLMQHEEELVKALLIIGSVSILGGMAGLLGISGFFVAFGTLLIAFAFKIIG